jgi:two-component system, sporulation sensor kinase A
MNKFSNIKLVFFFTLLTVILTLIVVFTWENALMSPLYSYFEKIYPGPENADYRWRMSQRIEHFFISITVDAIVVSLLLWLVNSQQRKLRLGEARYRAVFDHASDGIGVITVNDHCLVEANKRFGDIVGYQAESVIGKHVCELFSVASDGSQAGAFSDIFNCGGQRGNERVLQTWSGEGIITIQLPSGVRLPVFISSSTISTGKESLFILIIRDLTEQKRLEHEREEIQARLARSERASALGRMAAQVAHEVKNPLAGLRLYSLHLKGKVADKLPASELALVDKIAGGIEHLSNTVEQVLGFARPITLARRQVDYNQMVINALQLLEPQLKANDVKAKLELDDSGTPALLDETYMHSTLINLMLNSIQAMPNGGELTVSTAVSDQALQLEIADTGCGMSQEQIKNVFEPFYTTKAQGLGLGMIYAERAVNQHGGSILVESELGKGTRIRISVPLKGESSHAATSGDIRS